MKGHSFFWYQNQTIEMMSFMMDKMGSPSRFINQPRSSKQRLRGSPGRVRTDNQTVPALCHNHEPMTSLMIIRHKIWYVHINIYMRINMLHI